MKKVLTFLIIVIIQMNCLYSQVITKPNNKPTPPVFTYINNEEDGIDSTKIGKLWYNTERFTKKWLGNIAYSRKNGNLEPYLLTYAGQPVKKETVNGYELGLESYNSYKFVDTTKSTNLFYSDIFSFISGLHYHSYASPFGYAPTVIATTSANFSYAKAYGWLYKNGNSLSFYNSLGVSVDLNNTSASVTDAINFSDFFDNGVRYQFGKNLGFTMSLKESSMYNSFVIERWALPKIIELSGHAVLDQYLTPILINKKNQLTPIYQIAYQSLWSYLFYSIRKTNPTFPFSRQSEDFLMPDTRLIIAIHILVYE